MKKSLLLSMALAVGCSVWAQESYEELYVKGSMSNWEIQEGYKMTTTDGVNYFINGVTFNSPFKIANKDNSKEYCTTEVPEGQNFSAEFGVAYGVAATGGAFEVDITKGQISFRLDGANSKVQIDNGPFYLTGYFNNWSASASNYELVADGVQSYVLEVPATMSDNETGGSRFKITNGTWNAGTFYGNATDEPDKFALRRGSDIDIKTTNVIPQWSKLSLTFNPWGETNPMLAVEDPAAPEEVDALYIHFKYDLEEWSVANIATGEGFGYTLYNTNGGVEARSGKLERVVEANTGRDITARYALWKAPLQAGDAERYNAVSFWFEGDSSKGKEGRQEYRSISYTENPNERVDRYDERNWTKYIYSTAVGGPEGNKTYAVQTYLSFAKFLELDNMDIANGGRRNLYLVQVGKTTDPLIELVDNKGTHVRYLSREVNNDIVYGHDRGCFYIPLKVNGGSFKVSWLSVRDAVNALPAGYAYKESQREWSTFDLGIIGVDKNYEYTDPDSGEHYKPNYDRNAGTVSNGAVYMRRNFLVRYMNYNQSDWVLPAQTDYLDQKGAYGEVIGYRRWLVIDTHYAEGDEANTCKTATITSFDPHPTFQVSVSDVTPMASELTDADAEAMHIEHLAAADANGHIFMKRVNYASATADIKGTSLETVKVAKFHRKYSLEVDGTEVGSIDDTGKTEGLKLDYFPLDKSNQAVSVRTLYTSDNTGLKFHSRTGYGEVKAPNTDFQAPKVVELKGRYVFEKKTEDGRQVYGIYVEGLDCDVNYDAGAGDIHVYSDFAFDCGTKAAIVDKNHEVHKRLPNTVPARGEWMKGEDWSTPMVTVRESTPVFIHEVDTVESAADLEELTVNCSIYAIYPFMFNPDAQFEIIGNTPAQSAQRRAMDAAQFEGFKVLNTEVPTTVSFTVRPDNTVTSIDTITAEDADSNARAEYYTVMGVKVDGTPTPGVYIRVAGQKAEKVVVR